MQRAGMSAEYPFLHGADGSTFCKKVERNIYFKMEVDSRLRGNDKKEREAFLFVSVFYYLAYSTARPFDFAQGAPSRPTGRTLRRASRG